MEKQLFFTTVVSPRTSLFFHSSYVDSGFSSLDTPVLNSRKRQEAAIFPRMLVKEKDFYFYVVLRRGAVWFLDTCPSSSPRQNKNFTGIFLPLPCLRLSVDVNVPFRTYLNNSVSK
jgi:hypothetical protein